MNLSVIKLALGILKKIPKSENNYIWVNSHESVLKILLYFYISKLSVDDFANKIGTPSEIIEKFLKGQNDKGIDWEDLKNLLNTSPDIQQFRKQQPTAPPDIKFQEQKKDQAITMSQTATIVDIRTIVSSIPLNKSKRKHWKGYPQEVYEIVECFKNSKLDKVEFCKQIGLTVALLERFSNGKTADNKPWPELQKIIFEKSSKSEKPTQNNQQIGSSSETNKKTEAIISKTKQLLATVPNDQRGRKDWNSSPELVCQILECFYESELNITDFIFRVEAPKLNIGTFIRGRGTNGNAWSALRKLMKKSEKLKHLKFPRNNKELKEKAKNSKSRSTKKGKEKTKTENKTKTTQETQTAAKSELKSNITNIVWQPNGDVVLTQLVEQSTLLKIDSVEWKDFVKKTHKV